MTRAYPLRVAGWVIRSIGLSFVLLWLTVLLYGCFQLVGILDGGEEPWQTLIIGSPLYFAILFGPYFIPGTIIYLGIRFLCPRTWSRIARRILGLAAIPTIAAFYPFAFRAPSWRAPSVEPANFIFLWGYLIADQPADLIFFGVYLIAMGLLVRDPPIRSKNPSKNTEE